MVFVLSLISFTTNSNTLNSGCSDEEFIYWEDLNSSEKENILKSFEFEKNAVDYYNCRFTPSDNNETMSLLETITSIPAQEDVAKFYFYIFNQICLKADGALSEIIGKYCQKVIINKPLYVINYFKRKQNTLETYASLIGYELYFKEEGTSDIEYNFKDFKKFIEERATPKEEYSLILTEFFKRIEIAMRNTD
jgi:hypothetical protein